MSNRALRKIRSPSAYAADSHGQAPLRREIARYASYTRAVSCEADDVIVTAGAQQAFDMLARVVVTRGRTVVARKELPLRARVICLTPSHQFPLGNVMLARRRSELLDFARARRAVIIEDDYDGEFRFGGRPLDATRVCDWPTSSHRLGLGGR